MLKTFKWLYPGMGIKRWISLGLVGSMMLVLGVGFFYPNLFFAISMGVQMLAHGNPGGIPNWLAGSVFILGGVILAGYGLYKAFSLVIGEVSTPESSSLVELVYARRYLQRGPKIVVIGGGTGLSTMLKGLKDYTSNITAIVTVTDDGGSSGRLRGDLGILPPGDIRNCLVALADKESLMEKMLQYRFGGEGDIAGHNLGNLFLVALSDLAGGFYSAIQELSKVLAIRGRVLPSTLKNINIGARLNDGTLVWGESTVSASEKKIKQIYLNPEECEPLPEALEAIRQADAVVLGPGSLYTSIIPNLLVKGIAEEIKNCVALKLYVCNVMTQPGETKNYTASDHYKAIVDHVGYVADYVMVNCGEIPEKLMERYRHQGAAPVIADCKKLLRLNVEPVRENLVLEADVVRHNPQRLAQAILKLIFSAKSPKERLEFVKKYK